ncbi:MAG: cysteine desulfurase [Thaumarchaeota archaeon]|nr:cysteine desulfurase [Nitrososphaerota archaeon]
MKTQTISIERIRRDFPILNRRVYGNKQLVYLDNASTTQKPTQVIDTIDNFYRNYNSNIHRSVYSIANEATEAYESTRSKVAKFLGVRNNKELIFVRGTTEAINLVAYSWGRKNINEDDVVITTEYEHHSNIVPWQLITKEKKAKLKYIEIDQYGELCLDELESYLELGDVKLVTFSQMSNVLGTITDAKKIISLCKKYNVKTLIDGAQSAPHMKVNINELDCDFFACSAHKMLGPTGVGILWIRKEIMEEMNPFHGGGDMIKEVHKYDTTWNELPYKFEAGTPNIADVVGFSSSIDYINNIGFDVITKHEKDLKNYALSKLDKFKNITIYGQNSNSGGIISFNFADIHPHDLATILDGDGIAIRSGHHCAQVLMEKLNVQATSRISFYIYNTKEEIDKLITSLEKAARLFKL